MKSKTLYAALLSLSCSSCATYAPSITPTPTPSRNVSHAQYSSLASELQIKLNAHSALRGANIQVEFTSKSTMAMRGTVLTLRQKKRARQIVRKLTSTPVANELRVQSRR
ncbi:BON domain-containing protein [bacterium]|nr:MAG: BON domain-containing protein [bacterium]